MMAGHRAVMDLTREEWLGALGMEEADIPEAVIMEGSWWREQRTAWRLGYLEEVRELAFPDMFLGRWRGRPVVYSCVYGAARAVELAHLFGKLGTRRMVMIGTCGGLDPELEPGDVVVPSAAAAREGVARLYGAGDLVRADAAAPGVSATPDLAPRPELAGTRRRLPVRPLPSGGEQKWGGGGGKNERCV